MDFGSKIGAWKIPVASSLTYEYSRATILDPIYPGFGISLWVPVTVFDDV
jgi:hypothetical protein